MTAHTAELSIVRALLGVPRLEGTFRVRADQEDVTDAYSELRFTDPRLGGYLDRTQVERDLTARPLTVWLRGAWSTHAPALRSRETPSARTETSESDTSEADTSETETSETETNKAETRRGELGRNCWTLLIPPYATATVHSPRRAFAVVRPAVGRLDGAHTHLVGRTVEVRAGASCLVAQLDWLNETVATHLHRGFGVDLSEPVPDWHEAPLEAVVAEMADRVKGSETRTNTVMGNRS